MTLDMVGISEMQKCGLKYVTQNPRKVVGGSTNKYLSPVLPPPISGFFLFKLTYRLIITFLYLGFFPL